MGREAGRRGHWRAFNLADRPGSDRRGCCRSSASVAPAAIVGRAPMRPAIASAKRLEEAHARLAEEHAQLANEHGQTVAKVFVLNARLAEVETRNGRDPVPSL